ncbi:MAG: metal-dependent transcriptional regulator [Candidatus Binatia bacterium]|jgi:DtxR family Mn-dependent transcriptional regulator
MSTSKITPAIEDYLRTIYALEEEVQPVIAARVAEEVGVTPSTMVSTLRRLEGEGYLKVVRRKEIHLTAEGKQVAERILRRHFLLERFLTDLLELDWVKAHQEAHRLEHALSQDVEDRLAKLLGYPTTCPHGNPIPSKDSQRSRKGKGIPLHSIAAGIEVELDYITEGGERDARLLGFLQEHRLVPGTKVRVLDVAPSMGVMNLRVGQDEFSLGIEAAKKIRVH